MKSIFQLSLAATLTVGLVAQPIGLTDTNALFGWTLHPVNARSEVRPDAARCT
jgi:hypothetical protein